MPERRINMLQWPALLDKQLQDCANEDMEWRETARQRVFPCMANRLPAMTSAHGNLTALAKAIYSEARGALGFDSDATFVTYAGIGCGAGCLTTFSGAPAILFGLENVSESGWNAVRPITGLVAHEIGHLAHHFWRAQDNVPLGPDLGGSPARRDSHSGVST